MNETVFPLPWPRSEMVGIFLCDTVQNSEGVENATNHNRKVGENREKKLAQLESEMAPYYRSNVSHPVYLLQ